MPTRPLTLTTCLSVVELVLQLVKTLTMLFVSAKVSQYALLPQRKVEATDRVLNMVKQMDEEGFETVPIPELAR